MNPLTAVFLVVAIVAALVTGPRQRKGTSSFPFATIAMSFLVVGGFILQSLHPALLALFERHGGIFHHGEYWRAVTPLFFQDGGLAGGLFNIAMLIAVGSIAESLWGKARWLLLYLGCGILTEMLAAVWQPLGAGNSIACLALAGSIFAWGLMRGRDMIRIASLIGAAAGASLLWRHDIHGIAILLGGSAGAMLTLYRPRTF